MDDEHLIDELIATGNRLAAIKLLPEMLRNVFEPTRRALKAIELRLYSHAIELAAELWEAGTEELN
jgi:hypothetical protein